MNLNLRELQVLRALLNEGSVTAAARSLRISQPAVSKMIRSAEDRLGFELFHRHRKRLYPTPEAMALAPDLVAALSALEDLSNHAANLRSGRAGQLTISTSPAIASLVMPDLISRFRLAWPEVAVSLRTHTTLETVDLIAEQRADIGVIVGGSADPRTEMRVLWKDPVGCLMQPEHPLAQRDRLTLADLENYPIVTLSPGQPISTSLLRAMQEAEREIAVSVEASQSTSVCELVRAGVGVGVLDGLGLRVGIDMGLVARPLIPEIQLETSVILARHRTHGRAAQDCLEILREMAAERL